MENQPETKPAASVEVKRARRVAIVLAALICLAIMFFMYGQIQRTSAEKSLALANQYKMEVEAQRKIANEAQRNASRLADELSVAVMALQECKENQK